MYEWLFILNLPNYFSYWVLFKGRLDYFAVKVSRLMPHFMSECYFWDTSPSLQTCSAPTKPTKRAATPLCDFNVVLWITYSALHTLCSVCQTWTVFNIPHANPFHPDIKTKGLYYCWSWLVQSLTLRPIGRMTCLRMLSHSDIQNTHTGSSGCWCCGKWQKDRLTSHPFTVTQLYS